MVAATGLLSIVGTLLAYGGYTFINRLGKNVTSTLNKTQDNTVNSDEFINLLDNITLPMNISQISENMENVIKQVENTKETMELNVQNYSNNELNDDGNILPLGRELPETNELIISDSNQFSDTDQNQNPTFSYPHEPDTGLLEKELNNIKYDGQLNPKLILTTNNNEKKIKISEKEKIILKKLFDFEPFPSNKLQNKQNIDKIPQNPHYGTNQLETMGTKLKNPFFPTHDEHVDIFQDDLLDLNEKDIQSHKENVNPKLSTKFNSNLESNVNKAKDETIQNNETDSVVNDYLETDINIMDSYNLDNVDYNKVNVLDQEASVIGDLIENMENEILSNEIKKSFIGNTENNGGEDEAKYLMMSYAKIAGIVIGAVLIVTLLIFLSVRQALKHRRDDKVIKRYKENKVNQIDTLTYAYNIEG